MLVLHLHPGSLTALPPHRTRSGWEICEENGILWLRCPGESGDVAACAGLACVARYRSGPPGRLLPPAGTVPVARMPSGPWQSLADFLPVSPFPALLPGRSPQRLSVRLERSSQEMPPTALLVSLTELLAWADQASRLRFARLKFAAADAGRVLVTGTPLPPVPGVSWYFHGTLALPSGWDFAAPLLPAWVEQALALPPGAVALVHPDAPMEIIPQEALIPLTLSALRRTRDVLLPSW